MSSYLRYTTLASLQNQLSVLELPSESNPSRTIAGRGDLPTFLLAFLYTFFFQLQGRIMISRLRPFVLLLLALALIGAACSKTPSQKDSASTSLSPPTARPTIVLTPDFATPNDALSIGTACIVCSAPAPR